MGANCPAGVPVPSLLVDRDCWGGGSPGVSQYSSSCLKHLSLVHVAGTVLNLDNAYQAINPVVLSVAK